MEHLEALRDSIHDIFQVKNNEAFERSLSDFLYDGLSVISGSVESKMVLKNVIQHLKSFIPFDQAFLYDVYEKDSPSCLFKTSAFAPNLNYAQFANYLTQKTVINVFHIVEDSIFGTFKEFVGGSLLVCEIKFDHKKFALLLFNIKKSAYSKRECRVLFKYRKVVEQAIVTMAMIEEREKAESSNLLKTVFLANMSHELRTPLGSIKGFAELLNREKISKSDHREFVSIITKSSDRLLRVIDDILDISKIESKQLKVEKKVIKTSELLADLSEILSEKAKEKGIKLQLEMDKNFPELIYTDPLRLHQILLNLINNSIKFTHKGGVFVYAYLKNENLCFDITDSGKGILKKDQENVFGRFFQSENEFSRGYGGTGLGLPIARELARLLQGDVVLKESSPRGSCFLVHIRHLRPKNGQKRRLCDLNLRNEKLSVLVCDDDENSLLLAKELCKQFDWRVHTVLDPFAVLELLKTKDFDLVLTDIRMPKLDGFQLVKMLRKNGLQLPVFALTAHTSTDSKQFYTDFGFNGVLFKPLNINNLINEIENL